MRRQQSGFTLIELLVVVAIIGILTAIAIPAYNQYKSSAVDAQMISSLRNARTATEALYVKNGETYAGLTVALLEENGFRQTNGVSLRIVDAQVDRFQLRACANSGSSPAFLVDSSAGAAMPDSGSCA